MREVIRHPALDLVGVRVHDAAKVGVDASERCDAIPYVCIAAAPEEVIGRVASPLHVAYGGGAGPQRLRQREPPREHGAVRLTLPGILTTFESPRSLPDSAEAHPARVLLCSWK